MADDTDPWRVIKRWLALVVCAGYLGYAIPRNLVTERQGTHVEGVIVGYHPSATGRYFYPIVRVMGQNSEFDLKSTDSWRWKWYDIGAHVPVLNLPGRTCLVGSLMMRWSDVFLAAVGLALTAILALWSPAKK